VLPDLSRLHDCAICLKKRDYIISTIALPTIYLRQHEPSAYDTPVKEKAREEIKKTGFINYDVLQAHHPDADNHFAGM
jgi:hypothetical protein